MSSLTVLNWRLVATFLQDHDLVQLLSVSLTTCDAVDSDVVWRPIHENAVAFHETQSIAALVVEDDDDESGNTGTITLRRGQNRRSRGQQRQQTQHSAQRSAPARSRESATRTARSNSFLSAPFERTLEPRYCDRFASRSRVAKGFPCAVSQTDALADALLQEVLSVVHSSGDDEEDDSNNIVTKPVFLLRSQYFRKYIALRVVTAIPMTTSHLVYVQRSKEFNFLVSSVWQVISDLSPLRLLDSSSSDGDRLDRAFFFGRHDIAESPYLHHVAKMEELLTRLAHPQSVRAAKKALTEEENAASAALQQQQQQKQRQTTTLFMAPPRGDELRLKRREISPLALLDNNPLLITPMRELLASDLRLCRAVMEAASLWRSGARLLELLVVHIFVLCLFFGLFFVEGIKFVVWPYIKHVLLQLSAMTSFFSSAEAAWSFVKHLLAAGWSFAASSSMQHGEQLATFVFDLLSQYSPAVLVSFFSAVASIDNTFANYTTRPMMMFFNSSYSYIASIAPAAMNDELSKTLQTWENCHMHAFWHFPRDIYIHHPLN